MIHRLSISFALALLILAGCKSENPARYAEGPGCTNTCPYAFDNECDDGGEGADYTLCELGSDCADCGARTVSGGGGTTGGGGEGGGTTTTCTNTCGYAGDGECDDGGPGSDYSLCELGTDCTDCGSRSGTTGGGTGGTGGGGGTTSECTSNSSCGSRHVCRSGRCVSVECTSDSHCGSCSRCSSNVCRDCGSGPYGCYC